MSQKILIIESEPWLGDHYQRILEQENFTVVRAANAYSAMDLIDESLPQVIIMNLSLSGPSSLALLHELQTYIDTGNIPVVVCSSLQDIAINELQPYGVKQLIDSRTMQPKDLAGAVRSVTA